MPIHYRAIVSILTFVFVLIAHQANSQEVIWSSAIRVDNQLINDVDFNPHILITPQNQVWVVWQKETQAGHTLVARRIQPLSSRVDTLASNRPLIQSVHAIPYGQNHVITTWQEEAGAGDSNQINVRVYNSTSDSWEAPFSVPTVGDRVSYPYLVRQQDSVSLLYFEQKPENWEFIARVLIDTDENQAPDSFQTDFDIIYIAEEAVAQPVAIYTFNRTWVAFIEKYFDTRNRYRILATYSTDVSWSDTSTVFDQAEVLESLTLSAQFSSASNYKLWLGWLINNVDMEGNPRKMVMTSTCDECDNDQNIWSDPFSYGENDVRTHRQPRLLSDVWRYNWLVWEGTNNQTDPPPNSDIIISYWRNNQWVKLPIAFNPMHTEDNDRSPDLAHDQNEILWATWARANQIYAISGNVQPDQPTSGFAPPGGFEVAILNPTMECNFPLGPQYLQRFDFEIFGQNSNETYLLSTDYGENSIQASLKDNRSYTYRVQTFDSLDLGSGWTNFIQFFTNTDPEAPQLNGELLIINQAEDGTVQSRTPTFQWSPPTDNDPQDTVENIGFHLQVDRQFSFNSEFLISLDVDAGRTFYTLPTPLDENQRYYARLQAVDKDNLTSQWTVPNEFVINTQNDAPRVELLQPRANTVLSGLSQIEWEVEDIDGDSVIVRLDISLNNGQTWAQLPPTDALGQPLDANRNNYVFDVNSYESTPEGRIRITAFDIPSFASSSDVSDRFTISTQAFNCLPRVISPRSSERNTVNISYQTEDQCVVTLRIYSLTGRLVRVLIEERLIQPGTLQATWDGRDDNGHFVTPRPYICVLSVEKDDNVNQHQLKILVLPD